MISQLPVNKMNIRVSSSILYFNTTARQCAPRVDAASTRTRLDKIVVCICDRERLHEGGVFLVYIFTAHMLMILDDKIIMGNHSHTLSLSHPIYTPIPNKQSPITMFKVFKAIAHSYLYMHDDVDNGTRFYGLPVRVSFSYAGNELLDVTTPVKRTSTAVQAFYDDLDNAATIASVVGTSGGVYDLYITTDPKTYMPKDATMGAPKVYHRWCHVGANAAAVHVNDMAERAEYVRYYLDRAYPGSNLRIWMNGTRT